MGFRIHRGIFQKLNAERTAYENTFKIDDDGRIKEVDSEGNVTAGYLKVGEQASDADTVDGIHAGSFLRSDASDTYTGGNLVINSSGQYRVFHAKATRAAGLGTGSAGSNTPPFLFENAGGDQAWGVVAEFRINEDNRGGDSPAILFSDAQQSTQWTVGFDYTGSEFGIRKNRGIYSGGWGTSYFKINTSGKVFIPGELEVDSRVYADNGLHVRGDWLRVDGQNGIYFESYGGGWRMTDTSWIRAYNDKNIYTGGNIEVGGTIRANGNGFYVDSTNVINSAGKFIGNIDNSETKSDYFIQEAHGNPRNNLGSPTVTEMALFDSQFRCMTDLSNNYTNLDRLTFWVQQNEGDEWTEVTHSDTNKKKFLRTNNSGVVIPNRAYKFRVEFKAPGYVFANALYFYWSSQSHSTKVHVYKYNASQDTWHAHATSNTNVSSWPGHLYLPFSTIPWHETHTTSTGHHRYIRVEFIPNWSTGSYADRDIALYGGQIWGGYPSGRRTVHSINEDGNYYFPANLYAEGGSGDGSRLATRDWVGSNTLNQTEGDARYLGISAKAADANLLDGIDSGSFLRSDAEDTKSNNTMFTGPVWIDDSGRLGTSKYRWTNSALTTTSIEIVDDNGDNAGTCATLALHNYGDGGVQMRMGNTGDKWLYLSSAKSNGAGTTTDDNSERYFVGMKINNNTVWHAGNLTNVSQLTNDSSFATTSYVDTAVSNLVDSAPGALNTLNELAAALGDDANFSTTVTNAIAAKADASHNHDSTYLGITAKAADSNLFDGIDSVNFVYGNAKGTNDSVTTDADSIDKTGYYTSSAFTTRPSSVSNWMYIEHIKLYNSNTRYQKQIGYDTYDNRMWVRTKNDNNWSEWAQVWTSDVFTNNSSDWNTAYGWGNHADAGYLTSVPSEYLTQTEGDARYLQSLPSHNHDSLYHKLDFDAVTSAGRPDAESGTWVKTVSTTDWGSYKVGTDADAGRAYNDAPGYIEYNIPSGYSTAYIGQLKWSSGGYFDVHAKKTDGSLVHRGRYLSKQSIENSSHGGDHDGQQIIKVSGLDGMAAIRITNLVGRVHLQGIGWTKELDTDGTQDSTTHWDLINGKPSTFAPSSHNHDSRYYTETEMDTKLAAKANSSHTHSYNDLNDLPTIPSNNNQLTNGAGYITGSGNTSGYAGQLSDRGGYGNNSFSFNQESGTFAGYTGWANYFIGNHGNGATYYNTVHIMPFWGVPQYSRLEGGTFRGPWTYWTTENMSQSTVNTWNTAYGWGDHSTAGYVTSVTDALGYTPYQEGTALSTTTISATNKISLNGGHSTARVVIKYNHNGDDTSENSGNLVMWTSEPGISYPGSGIGGNIHESGHYYGKRNANIPYGVALRFNVTSGRAEFLATNSTNNGSFGVGWYVDDRGNTVQQGGITAPGYNNGNWDTAYGWGNHASAGYLTSVPNIDASKITSGTLGTARIPNLAASKITSGTFANARISQSSVTQHQGALSIAASQVTGLPAQTPPINATVEGGEESTLASIHFSPGEGAATFTLADGQTFRLAFAR